MITKLKKFFEKVEKVSVDPFETAEKPRALKKGSRAPEKSDFLGDFTVINQNQKQKAVKEKEASVELTKQKPMIMNSRNREILKESIVISLDFPVDRNDLQFIGNSRKDGKPIYRYIGSDFSTFNLPYDEVISLSR